MKKKVEKPKTKASLIISLLFAIAAAFGYEFSPEFQVVIDALLVQLVAVML